MTAGGIVPILAGAAARRRAQQQQEEEEESMSSYKTQDLDGWEFKIVRSTFGRFSNYEAVQKICHEEAETGWELVEKFDSCRLRFKRRVERRSNDHMARLDPYRTSPGMGGNATKAALIVGLILLLLGVGLLLFLGPWSERIGTSLPTAPILLLLVIIPLVLFVVSRRRR
jgi:hypothetical protein